MKFYIKKFEELGEWELANSFKLDCNIQKENTLFQDIIQQLPQDNNNFFDKF